MLDDPATLLAFAHQLADEADPIALAAFDGELTISAKPDRTLVTQADTGIERLLRDRIASRYPAHGILGEEYGTEPGDGETRWIVDPIDGTHNFVRGIPVWATLLAVERAGELVASVVSAPALDRRWFATRGGGAGVRAATGERRIHVSAIGELAEAQIVYSTLRGLDEAGHAPALRTIVGGAWRDRGFGDFWGYMLVAQGSAEVMLEVGPTLWDLAAPALVVREAGGRMTDLAGAPSYQGPGAMATNGLLHDRLVELLAGA